MSNDPSLHDPLAQLFANAKQAGEADDDLQTAESVAHEAAKNTAISAAMSAFSAEQHAAQAQEAAATSARNNIFSNFVQGIWKRLRPIEKSPERSKTMTNQMMLWRYGAGITVACAALITIGVGFRPSTELSTAEYQPVALAPLGNQKRDVASTPAAPQAKEKALLGGTPKDAVEHEALQEQIVVHGIASAESDSLAQYAPSARKALQAAPALKRSRAAELTSVMPEPQANDRFKESAQGSVKLTSEEPVSTFSIDVDTAAYSYVRRQLNQGRLPQQDAVRIEEMINYFPYDYPLPENRAEPFATQVLVSDSPWKVGNKLVHIGIQGYEIDAKTQPKSNLVFLLDVSGSMNGADRLPLVKQSMALLLEQLQPTDTVAIAVYAGAAGTVLEPTPVKDKHKILKAMNQLNAGGSTAGAQGIELAYQLAARNMDKNAVNRVILATDGDFNVGLNGPNELKRFIERKRESGIFLSVLGFGQGNYHDALMQELAQNGNGIAAYIDTLSEAQKVLVQEATSSLFPIAKDVKIQVEFNPNTVSEYRLIGYETRALKREDFNNDKVDAGDIGAGHSVTAIYEITPQGAGSALVDVSRYATAPKAETAKKASEYGFVKVRYKLPNEDTSTLLSQVIPAQNNLQQQPKSLQREATFATAVAGFGQLLKGGSYTGQWNYDDAIAMALANRGDDPYGYRNEFVQLIRKAQIAN